MTSRNKILLCVVVLLLAALACTTVSSLFENEPQQPDIGPAVQDEDPEPPDVEGPILENPVLPEPPVEKPVPESDQDAPALEDSEDDSDKVPPLRQFGGEGIITATGDAARVEVIELNWYEDEEGYLTFLGLLKNNGNEDLVFLELAFILRDEDGAAVASDFTYSALDVFPAGEISPFEMYFYDMPADPWVSYEILIEGDVNDFFEYYADFEVLNAELQEATFGYDIVGEIKNVGSSKTDFVNIYAAVYDAEDQLIAVDFTFVDEDDLSAGETSTFTLSIWDTLQDLEADHFDLYIQGNLHE